MVPLAMPDDLGAFMKSPISSADLASAELILDVASDIVRGHLKIGDLNAAAGDVVELDPVNGGFVLLPSLPVTAVSLVETFDGTAWSTVLPAMFTVSKRLGIIRALPWTGVQWPSGPETWRVTYDHGFEQIPPAIVGAVLGIASRRWSNPENVLSETFGPHTVKRQMDADGFTAIERKALAQYLNPNVA